MSIASTMSAALVRAHSDSSIGSPVRRLSRAVVWACWSARERGLACR
ncbi:hypothetical protein [Nocardiopsis sp. LOL_012]